ncbi:MAG: O-antigen ligase family protein [Flavobacteriales bacterium]|nr:O-antigen ligase family protein [Flavobacteriales bacterium]
MLTFLRQYLHLIAIILMWVFTALYLGPLIYAVLPLTMFVFRSREMWPELILGFLIILVFSDISPVYQDMRKIKSAKYAVMVALGLIFLIETNRFQPLSAIFLLFLPFFVYAFFPLLLGSDLLNGMSKTISYSLLYLLVPNYILYNFRRQGWSFFRDLSFFIITIMLAGYVLQWVNPEWVYVAGRFRGLFGNPNGLGIFCYVSFMLVYLINYLNPSLFTRIERVFLFGVIGFILIKSGSRTSVVATSMFLLFGRFFSLSPFLGFISFIAFLGIVELISSNLASIVISLGLEKYFRVETLEDGSGRYFAWNFAWEQINKGGFLIFGGGFGNDEWVMRHNYPYLRSMGHHGGVHNSYLTMWFNTGIVGLLIYFRSYFLLFLKANKQVPIAFAVMFSSLFSVMYESWLTGSLNPFTIILVISMTLLTEPDIMKGGGGYRGGEVDEDEVGPEAAEDGAPATVTV